MAKKPIEQEIELAPDDADPEVEIVEEPQVEANGHDSEQAEPDLASELTRIKSEHERVQAELQAERAKSQQTATELTDSRLTTISNALDSAQKDADAAEQRLAKAYEDGDGTQIAKLTRELNGIEGRRRDLEVGKQRLEYEIEASKSDAAIDPAEKMIRTLSPVSQSWARQHTDVFRDQSRMKSLERAHYSALADGISVDTPEYFQRIDERLGFAEPIVEIVPNSPPVRQQRQAAPAAPPSRSGPTSSTGRSSVVRLTAEEMEAARISNMSPADYAREKERLRVSGDLGKFLN